MSLKKETMYHMKKIICILLMSLPMSSYANEEKAAGVTALSPELRSLLSQEMLALQSGMMSLIPAIISGKWDAVAATAGKIKNSYILKQKLTKAQGKELHSLLPADFIKQDQQFHYLAGMLEHAAKAAKPELISFYYSRMTESCVSCHSSYATHKFPAFSKAEKTPDHDH